MNLVTYDPFRELRSLQDDVNRLFRSSFTRGGDDNEMMRGAWAPSVDIFENKDNIVLEAELPGMKQEDFDLSIENNVITLRGERKFEKTDETDNYHRVERSYGSFTRSFTLPQTVSAEGATAEYNNGVLRVMLPKKEETKSRRIQVTGAAGGTQQKTIDTTAETGKAKEATSGR